MTDKLRDEFELWQKADKTLLEEITRACGFSHYDECEPVLKFITRARAEALEEAAQIADEYAVLSPLHNYGPGRASDADLAAKQTGGDIAAAIRALKEKSE